jgi:long-chain fatty acid transport protein
MFSMRKTAIASRVAILALAAGAMGNALATNGYFPHGYGMKAAGMGGASVASSDNGFAGANNPAAAAWSGTRIDAGASIFMPKREYSRTEAFGAGGPLGGSQVSDSNAFLVPEFGYNRIVSDKLGVGLTVYGNGGMNTNYAGGNTGCATDMTDPATGYVGNALCGPGRLGVNLMQLVVAPTVAYKVSDRASFGVSPLLVYQRFKAEGLEMFTAWSGQPGSVTGQGYDSSHGMGVRLGFFGKMNDMTSFGLSYSPKVNMSKFSKYAGLFADGGDFDIPANLTVGFSAQVTPKVRLAADYSSIKYSGVSAIANPSANAMTAGLGGPGSGGFGWTDVNVVKVGVEWQQTNDLTLRAGVNIGDNPVQANDVTFNIIAPGVTTSHLTFGGTYALSKGSELTFAYMYAPKKSVTGPAMFNGLIPAALGGAPNPPFMETIQMSQQSLGVQYSWKF